MRRARGRYRRVAWLAAVLAGGSGCGGGSGDNAVTGDGGPTGEGGPGSDGGKGASEAGKAEPLDSGVTNPYLQLGLSVRADAGAPIYPYNGKTGDNTISFGYHVALTATKDFYDLEIDLPMPDALAGQGQVTVSSGWYSGILRGARRLFDWVSPEMGAQGMDVTFTRDPHLFGSGADALRGELAFSTQARVVQYDQVLATSASASVVAYLPAQISAQDFELASGQIDGDALYVSARPRSGADNGRGGVYRVALADGTVTRIASHAARTDQMAPFAVDGDDLFFVTFVASDGPSILQRTRKDGTGTPANVPLPSNTNRVVALATDSTHLYLVLQLQGDKYVVFRDLKSAPGTDTAMSSVFAHPVEDTLALSTDYVAVMQESPMQILRFAKADLPAGAVKLADVGSGTGPRSLACSDQLCFWTEWTDGNLFQVPIQGGAKTSLQSTNQPIVWDGQQIYSGINGLVRVGPNGSPAGQRLFVLGGPIRLLAASVSHVYFVIDSRIWRIHK